MTDTTNQIASRHYWVSRPDRENLEIFSQELTKGKLRQGWGGDDEQNLHAIHQITLRGGDWWSTLSESQQGAYGNWRFFPGFGEGTIRKGDIVLMPNIPDWGKFSIVEVVDDEYVWDPIELTQAQNAHDCDRDYGHVRHVRLLTPSGVAKHAEAVDARLRSTLKTPMRMWNIDYLGDAVEKLLTCTDHGQEISLEQRFLNLTSEIRAGADKSARKAGKEIAESLLGVHYQAAEFEIAVAAMLRKLFPGGAVQTHGGPAEVQHGTDVLVSLANPLQAGTEDKWLIPVQVKMHTGTTWDGVEQLMRAADYWAHEGRVLGVALLTTADELAKPKEEELKSFCREKGIGCYIIVREQLLDLFTEAALTD